MPVWKNIHPSRLPAVQSCPAKRKADGVLQSVEELSSQEKRLCPNYSNLVDQELTDHTLDLLPDALDVGAENSDVSMKEEINHNGPFHSLNCCQPSKQQISSSPQLPSNCAPIPDPNATEMAAVQSNDDVTAMESDYVPNQTQYSSYIYNESCSHSRVRCFCKPSMDGSLPDPPYIANYY